MEKQKREVVVIEIEIRRRKKKHWNLDMKDGLWELREKQNRTIYLVLRPLSSFFLINNISIALLIINIV